MILTAACLRPYSRLKKEKKKKLTKEPSFVEREVFLTTSLRVQALSVGVEPLDAGERVSGDVAINQRRAPLPGNYLAHFSEHNWNEAAAVCHVVVLCTVPIRVHR